jgi:ankyrin repeat protein
MPDLKVFHEQVKRGDVNAVRTAVAEDPALLDATNETGQNAFLLAKYYGQHATADYLLSLNPSLDVFTSAVAGKQEKVLSDIEHDPSLLSAHSGDGWTVLHLAAFFGHPELTAVLIEKGAQVDARSTNAMQNTPLHAAVAGRHLDAVRVLLDNKPRHKAYVNARQHGGWTPLHGAAQNGDRAMVELLIANGADIHARAENNQSPLDLALTKAHHEIVALLEELGAKLQ